jgi:hypothetical protein
VVHAKAIYIYNKDQLPLRVSLEMAVRRAGGWCEMATSLQASLGAEDCPLLEDITKQHSEDCD